MNLRIILFSLTLLFTQFAYSKTDLKLNLKVGESYHQNMESKSTINQVNSKNNIDLLMTTRSAMTFTVTGINEDYYMDVNYDSLSMQMSMPDYSMSYNSESPNGDGDYISILMSEMKNKNFKIVMSDKGEILNVSGFEMILKNAFEKLNKIDSDMKAKLEKDLKNAFGSESFTNSFETITAIYPPEPVEFGRQWKSEIDLNKNMPIRLNTLYKFKEETDDFYVIEAAGTIISLPVDEFETSSSPYNYELTGTSASLFKIDKNTGWIKEANISQIMSGFSTPKVQPDPNNPLKIEMQFEIITTYID